MPKYQGVINILLQGRPQSSREPIAKVVQRLGEIMTKEAAKIQEKRGPSNEEAVWEAVRYRRVFEEEMRNLLKEVDRMHVLYVYSRFLNSRAVGPPLVKAALGGRD